jgi:hypothetical protein
VLPYGWIDNLFYFVGHYSNPSRDTVRVISGIEKKRNRILKDKVYNIKK